jgi:hypothetical protein
VPATATRQCCIKMVGNCLPGCKSVGTGGSLPQKQAVPPACRAGWTSAARYLSGSPNLRTIASAWVPGLLPSMRCDACRWQTICWLRPVGSNEARFKRARSWPIHTHASSVPSPNAIFFSPDGCLALLLPDHQTRSWPSYLHYSLTRYRHHKSTWCYCAQTTAVPMAVPAVVNGAACKVGKANGVGSPIAKIVMADGREELIYAPIPGLEHLFQESHTLGRSQCAPLATSDLLINAGMPQHSPKRSQNTAVSPEDRPTSLKRRRSSDDDEEDENRVVANDESNTFYIGDFNELERFIRQRFKELTMKPLRGIVTSWIKLLEPRRLGTYGKYHEMLPSQMSEDATPPWWPKTIIYKEPSHLGKDGMSFV